MVWGDIFGGIGSAIIGGATSALGAQVQNKVAQREAAKQRDFQEKMYKNRYRYQMEDMRRAGLNPILAYQNAPPGAPSGAQARVSNVGEAAVQGAASGATTGLANLQREVLREQADSARSQAGLNRTTAEKQLYETRNLMLEEVSRAQHIDITAAEVARAAQDEALVKAYPWLRNIGAVMRELGLGGAGTAAVGAGVGGGIGYWSARSARNAASKLSDPRYGSRLPLPNFSETKKKVPRIKSPVFKKGFNR